MRRLIWERGRESWKRRKLIVEEIIIMGIEKDVVILVLIKRIGKKKILGRLWEREEKWRMIIEDEMNNRRILGK